MRRATFQVLLTFTLSTSTLAAASLPPPNKESLDYYRHEHGQYPPSNGQPLDAWEDALVAALAKSSPDGAADALSRDFGLPKLQMEELVRLWLFVHANFARPDRTQAQEAEVRQRFLALLAASHRSPLVMHAAADTLMSEFPCRDAAAAFDGLMEGNTDRAADAWTIARAGDDCATIYARFAQTAPDRALPALLQLSVKTWLKPGEMLPLLDYLTSPSALTRIDAEHRAAAATYLRRLYLANLVGAGLIDRALRLYDSLGREEKANMLAAAPSQLTVSADGLPFEFNSATEKVRTGLAAAFALAGRTSEASALLAADPDLAKARQKLRCNFDPAPRAQGASCENSRDGGSEVLLLDEFLNHPADDPYPIAEVFYAIGANSEQGTFAELECRVFAGSNYSSLCQMGRDETRQSIEEAPEEESSAEAVIEAARIPEFEKVHGDFAPELAVVAARGKGAFADRRSYRDRPAVDPDPPAFQMLPIPEALRGEAPAARWPKSFTQLAEGYEPVRIARDGQRVAVISVSQNYDPTGEVSRGGYWVHFSGDGGRTWKRPLYTGLSEHFPYLVVPNPRLPLFDGDTLNLAVDINLLDTRSIMYPPVALATRRSEKNLYLRIPIADLERDSDGDGLTDLAARHLLLRDATIAPGATPFVVGRSDSGSCTTQDSAARAVMQAILQQIFSVRTRALIQPVDREPGQSLEAMLAAMGTMDANSADRPILVEGDPADFACLRPDRLMIVYTAADLERLRRKTPDFHAVKLNKVIFNRALDRGYLIWSSGWTGGTFRLRRQGTEWKLETLSSWIT